MPEKAIETRTVPEVAERLRLHRQTVYELIWSGQLRHSRVGPSGRRIVVPESAIQEYLEHNEAHTM